MAVAGQTPTEVHLNGSSPAIPAGGLPVTFQGGTPYPDPNNPTLDVTDVSAYVAIPSPAQGTILVYNGSAWVPLAVGTDGQVLTAESGQTTGLEWMTAGGGGGGGAAWFAGSGAPTTIAGQANGDFYLNTANGAVYELISGTWTLQCNITGPAGAAGANGTNGTNGTNGARGSLWYSGSGAPGTISGQANNDMYLNTANGAVYELVSGTWTLECNITGPTGAAGGALVLIEEHTASSSASLQFTSSAYTSGTYDEYEIHFVNIIPSSSGSNFEMQFSTDNVHYDAGANYYWGYTYIENGGATGSGGANAADFLVLWISQLGGTTYSTLSGVLRLYGINSTTLSVTSNDNLITRSTTYTNSVVGVGVYAPSTTPPLTPVVGFQFFFSSGNIASGTIRVYGLTH